MVPLLLLLRENIRDEQAKNLGIISHILITSHNFSVVRIIQSPACRLAFSLWRKLSNLSPLGDLPPLPTIANRKMTITPNPEARSSGRRRKLRMAIGVLIVIVTICAAVGLNVDSLAALVLVGVSIGVAYRLPRGFQQKRAIAVENVVRYFSFPYSCRIN